MREDVRRKLDRVLWQQRLRQIGMVAIALAAVGVLFLVTVVYQGDGTADGTLIKSQVFKDPKSGMERITLDVKLDDGHEVLASAGRLTSPRVGSRLRLAVRKSLMGYHGYTAMAVLAPQK